MKSAILGCGYVGLALLELWKGGRTVAATTTRESRRQELELLADEVFVTTGRDIDAKILSDVDQLVVAVAPRAGESSASCYLETALALSEALPGAKVQQLVVLSSTSVYSECHGHWVTEESPRESKGKMSEILCRTEDIYLEKIPPQIETTVLRLAGIFGPGREPARIAKKLSGTEAAGSGSAFTNWIHRDDIARGIDWILSHHLCGVYNLCCDSHPTKDELYAPMLSRLNLPAIRWNPSLPPVHGGNKRVSCEKLKSCGFRCLLPPN